MRLRQGFRLSLGKFIALLVAIAVLTMGANQVALFFIAWRSVDEIAEKGARAGAEQTVRNIGQTIALLNHSLQGFAGETRLAAIIAQPNPALIRAEEDRLTRLFPGASLVRLLPENIDTLDETRSPHMGFSDLNMVQQALEAPQQPAVHLANSPDAHLAMARRLDGGGGIIHVSLPLKILQGALAEIGACGLELRQETLELAYRGDPQCKDSDPDGEWVVAGLPWKIAYWAPREMSVNVLWFIAALLVSALVLGGCAFFLHRILLALFRRDNGYMINLVQDLLNGYVPGDYSFRLAEVDVLGTAISKLKAVAGAPSKPAPQESEAPGNIEALTLEPAAFESAVQEAMQPMPLPAPRPTVAMSPTLFRAYDIRGIVGETLNSDIVYALGRAIGGEMAARGETRVAIAHDGRLSSPMLNEALARGLVDSGRMVTDLGLAPTPLLYYATYVLSARSGVMLTGSHNPANYNGLKIVIGGDALYGEDIQKLRQRIERNDFVSGSGRLENHELIPDYIERVIGDIQLGRDMKIVMDCGNGVASLVAPELMRALGCEVIELFCEVDGHFPNHHPDPGKPENLAALIAKVRETGADLGLAYDGDGDRLGLIDSSGKIIWPDRQMMLFSTDVLSREPGADILFDVKSSRYLASQIVKNGGRPLMWKSGHSLMKAKMKETGAMLAGEMSGHFFFFERWYGFDDGIYAGARMVEILSNEFDSSAEVFAQYPDSVSTPEIDIPIEEEEKFTFIETLRAIAHFPDARMTEIDGLRVDFLDGWGLVRASNTTPSLVARFEADNEDALARIQQQFKELMLMVRADISLPF